MTDTAREEAQVSPDRNTDRSVVFVVGAGRSGTSTVAGALHHLGLTVPEPWVPADKSNPRGFFETRWMVWRNQDVLQAADMLTMDAAPGALDHASRATNPALVTQMREALSTVPTSAGTVVLKDPRIVWTMTTWAGLAQDLGFRATYLTMLRHPAEVLRSRKAHYKDGDQFRRNGVQASQLAGWLNVNLVTERQSRGSARTFVNYDDLLTNWRLPMQQVADELGVVFNTDLRAGGVHAVDSFIEPGLHRNRGSWDEVEAPAWLIDLARDAYENLCDRASGRMSDDDLGTALDETRREYNKQYEYSAAIVSDRIRRQVHQAEASQGKSADGR